MIIIFIQFTMINKKQVLTVSLQNLQKLISHWNFQFLFYFIKFYCELSPLTLLIYSYQIHYCNSDHLQWLYCDDNNKVIIKSILRLQSFSLTFHLFRSNFALFCSILLYFTSFYTLFISLSGVISTPSHVLYVPRHAEHL